MILKFFAWLFDWELVALFDSDGEIVIRRVHYDAGGKFAWRIGLYIRRVSLLPNNKVDMCCYVDRWETVRLKKRKKSQSLLTTSVNQNAKGTLVDQDERSER
jgi:hypothetical protein